MAEMTAQVGYSNFIAAAARSELPVGFLYRVRQSSYCYAYGDSSFVVRLLNLMVLEAHTLETGAKLALPPPFESSDLGTLYHESTHAWLDLMKDDPEVAKLLREGKQYYTDAPLKGGKKADDPGRLFHEAMGMYVGHRITVYWRVLETLTYLEAASRESDNDRAQLLRMALFARADYARAMGERAFGYQNPPGLFSLSRDQVYTTRVISSAAKDFCDRVLLEGKISDQFQRQPALTDLWGKLREQAPELR